MKMVMAVMKMLQVQLHRLSCKPEVCSVGNILVSCQFNARRFNMLGPYTFALAMRASIASLLFAGAVLGGSTSVAVVGGVCSWPDDAQLMILRPPTRLRAPLRSCLVCLQSVHGCVNAGDPSIEIAEQIIYPSRN
jgi:hypothetical protein